MRLLLRRFPAVGGLLLFALLCTALLAAQYIRPHGATIIVTNTNDSGPGSLRQALADANDGDTIQFDPALNNQMINLTSAELAINKSITISGPGPNVLTVSRASGASGFRIFHVISGTVVIEGLTIKNGITDYGGGIRNDGATLTINNCTISGNTSFYGGGIYNAGGTVSTTNSTVSNNHASVGNPCPIHPNGEGGGIYNASGTFNIANSTISNNVGSVGSGGIYNSGTLQIANSTINNNSIGCGGVAGGISNSGMLQIANSTISNNTAGYSGGGISNGSLLLEITNSTLHGNSASIGGGIDNRSIGTLQIGNTILDANSSGNISNNFGAVISLGYNLSSDDAGGFLTAPGDQINTAALLGPLQYNGGPTFTHELLPSSPAINAGNPDFSPPPLYDQRGPGWDRVFNGRIDIGSLEVQPVTPSPTPTATPTATATATVTATPGPCVGSNWGTTATAPDTAPNCAFHDDPGCVTDSTLDTPVFMSGTGFTTFYFTHSYDLEEGHDGGVLEISINGGPFLDIIEAGARWGTNGYNGTITTGTLSPIAGRAAWTGNSGGYVGSYFELPPSAAFQNVRIRFRLATDCSGTGNGWRIDSIYARYPVGCPPITPAPTPCDGYAVVFAENFDNVTAPALPPGWVTSFNVGPANCIPTATATPTPSPGPAHSLNLSTRMLVQTGDNVGVGGFIITGSAPKQVVLRAIGPSLAPFGIPNVLADPVLELHGPAGFPVYVNDNWRDTQDPLPIIEAGLAPTDDRESALLVTIDPGAYTAVVKGINNTTGIGLVEVYDLGPVSSQLGNISTRAYVGTGGDVVIGGFILAGGNNTNVVIRGIGPSLGGFGIPNPLADPTLELRDNNGGLLSSNDNCAGSILPPPDPLEACIEASLSAGAYTAILAGKNGGTGVGLVEIYNLN